MKKYGVMVTRGDASRGLEVIETRKDALMAKRLLKETHSGQDVPIDAIYGDFDASGNLTRNRYQLLYEI